jgi:hypothetical protein
VKYYWCTLIWLSGWCAPLFATEVVWPTSMNRQTIHSFEDFIQPTVSGKISSGTFGMVREDGKRFHEGIDIRPSRVLANGEAADRIFSAIAGQTGLTENTSFSSTLRPKSRSTHSTLTSPPLIKIFAWETLCLEEKPSP